jgi:hypothetical protein
MNHHPINLGIRFLLEIILLIIIASWGWHQFSGVTRNVLAIGLPVLTAAIWGIFKVDGDPGKAIVAIPGWLRLLYEILLFILAAYFLFQLQLPMWAYAFIIVSAIHYLISYDRVVWLLKKRQMKFQVKANGIRPDIERQSRQGDS